MATRERRSSDGPAARIGVRSLLASLLIFGGSLADAATQEKSSWQVEWNKALAAARKEGQVNVYIYNSAVAVIDAGVFQKRFPGIKVVAVPGRGVESQQRILNERRAGKYLADVLSSGITTYGGIPLEAIPPALILPEVVDESKWWHGQHRYGDAKRRTIFIYAGKPQIGGVSYYTPAVDPKELQSFWDFLQPKWKGKIEARDIRISGPGGGAIRLLYHHPQVGPSFIRRLFSEMDVTLFRDSRQGLDWLARGKFAICFFCNNVDRAKRQGLPVDEFGVMKEGAALVANFGTVGLVNKGPHPNAARVFVNWLLSREGQLTLQKSLTQAGEDALDSLRIDIPKDDVPPSILRMEGVKYLELDTLGRIDMRPIVKLLEEALRGQ